MPDLIPDWLPWMRPAGRLIWACLLMAIGLGVAFYLYKRPKSDRPATWAECMSGAVGVFALMTLAYAVIPHEWITFSDQYLEWNTTKFVFRSNQDIFFLPVHWPFTMDQQAVRDIVVTLIYLVFLGLNLKLFVDWQNRGKAPAAKAEASESRLSRFGRPLRRARRAPAPVTSTASGNGDG
jgi:hypothetical protein